MKPFLPLFVLLLLTFGANSQDFVINNELGISCIKHRVEGSETFYKVAEKYFVRPSTLAICNNISNPESLSSGRVLNIPLTETNYYKLKGLSSTDAKFQFVYHVLASGETLNDIKAMYFVNGSSLKEWNNFNAGDRLDVGSKIKVGFVKYKTAAVEDDEITPHFIFSEKIEYGTQEEKKEALAQISEQKRKTLEEELSSKKEEVARLERQNNRPVIVASNDNSIVLEQEEPEPIQEAREQIIETPSTPKPIKKQGLAKNFGERISSKLNKSASEKTPKVAMTAYERKKEKNRLRIERASKPKMSILEKLKLEKKEELAKEEPTKVVEEIATIEPEVELAKEEVADEPELVNKLQRLNLLRKTSGNAAFFYSGFAKGKFYVFTNVAKKGGIIKITNLDNGRYILAEVIDYLPEADRKKGYIAKMSNNAILPLGNPKSESVKIQLNY